MLEKKRSKGSVKFGTNNNTGMVMTHKQVQQLLQRGTEAQLPNTVATLSDMKSLCTALLEAVGDKTLALAHQKKANKVLAGRISELEQRLEAVQGGRVALFPSQLLLEGYSSSEVDRSAERIGHSESNGGSVASAESSNVIQVVEGVNLNASDTLKCDTPVCKDSRSMECSVQVGCEESACYSEELPPQLRQMVEKALEEIRLEAKSSYSDIQGSKN